jgi:hypothetical protein
MQHGHAGDAVVSPVAVQPVAHVAEVILDVWMSGRSFARYADHLRREIDRLHPPAPRGEPPGDGALSGWDVGM